MNYFTTAAAIALLAAPVAAETLKVSSYLPPMHTFNRAIEAWGAELTEATGGELTLEMYSSAQLGPPPRQFDLIRAGAADIAVILHSATPGRFPLSELAGLPLTHPSAGNNSAVTSRRLTELADQLADEHRGAHILWMGVTPPLKMHFADVDPSDVGNIAGTRVRYAGLTWQQIIEALGASPVPVPPAETADAMGKGVVDAATFPFEATMPFHLGPVTKYTLEPGIASATFALVMSDQAWNRLSDDQRAAITETTGPDRAEWFGTMWDESEAKGRTYMSEAGTTIVSLSDDQLAGMQETFVGIVDSAVSAAGPTAADFLAAYTE